jgi:hypothetical protein
MINRLLLAWTIVGAPALFAVYVWWSYVFAYSRGGLPQSELPPSLWIVAFAVSAGSGVLALFMFLDRKARRKAILLFAYGIAIIAVNLIVHVIVACSMGDCI